MHAAAVKAESQLQLQVEDEDAAAQDQHPSCPHGPTVLFYRGNPSAGYYACAAHRNPKLCDFRMPAAQWRGNALKRVASSLDYPQQQALSAASDPTYKLLALSQDEVHAQYFFDQNALHFFAEQCRHLKISKLICIGAPRLHFHLRETIGLQSFLLDFDERFAAYLSPEEFCLYNMCNNHFFYPRQPFEQFLECGDDDRLLVVTDPPFGCRTELIAQTLRSITRLHNRLNGLPHTPIAIMWVYPYYSANHIQQQMPELLMGDYKINYTNHLRYTNVGETSRKHGSPVRVFSNVPAQLLRLPLAEGYEYCEKCQRYTSAENSHCDRCETCPSKNGQAYRHCHRCDLCVKPNYVHCESCRRCTQREGHNCELYQSKQSCWICGQRGHIETHCVGWKRKRKPAGCLICGRSGHSELKCKQRRKYIIEFNFMNHSTITLKKL